MDCTNQIVSVSTAAACCFVSKTEEMLSMYIIGDVTWKKLYAEAFYIGELFKVLDDYSVDSECITDAEICTVINRLQKMCDSCGCGGVIPNPTPELLTNPDGIICSESLYTFNPVANLPGTTITWSRAAVAGISNLAATGIGVISETLINTTSAPIVVTYVISMTYNSIVTTVNHYVTVNPLPAVTTVLNDIDVFPGDTITVPDFTSDLACAEFSWTNTTALIGIGLSGTGNMGSWTAPANYTGEAITGTIVVTANCGDCVGESVTFDITVEPTPLLYPADGVLCPGDTITLNFITYPLTTYAWTNDNVAIGLGASGSGAIPPWTAPTNDTGLPIIGHITVTATINGVPQTPHIITITINATPYILDTFGNPVLGGTLGSDTVTCGDPYTYEPLFNLGNQCVDMIWSREGIACCNNGVGASGTGNIAEILTCTGAGSCTVVYTITICGNGGCFGNVCCHEYTMEVFINTEI